MPERYKQKLSIANLGYLSPPPNPGVGWVGPERPAETWADVKADPLSALFDLGRGLVTGNAPKGQNLQGLGAMFGAAIPVARALKAEVAANDLKSIIQKWESAGVKLDVAETPHGTISVSRIVVPEAERNKGIGTAAMQDITAYADRSGKPVTLSPSKDFGASSLPRLRDFYKRLGFVENRGQHADLSISDSMVRPPNRNSESNR